MAQFQVQTRPININEVGSNNNIFANLLSVIGEGNTLYSSFSFVNGVNNVIFLKDTITGVFGIDNRINGTIFSVGNNNELNNNVFNWGDSNIITGNVSNLGSNNTINGDIFSIGNNNNLNGSVFNIGLSNSSSEAAIKSYVIGENNVIGGGMIYQDISGFTNSQPEEQIDPYLSTNLSIKLIGDGNKTGTYSNSVISIGNRNIIGSASNLFIIGDDSIIEDLSNQLYINTDVNIKGAVLPCNLIQTYTPNNYLDPFGVSGSIVKDDESIYVKTDGLGWRQIPFNNSYGNFYDTTIQTNPTASTANKMRFNSTADSKTINVVNNNIYVDFDGLYNIQFSAQLDKTDSGTDNVDIWLRYNGVDVSWSNTRVTLVGNNAKSVAAWNFYQPMTASSYFNIMWSSADTNVRIYSQGTQSSPTRPSIPSVILTVDKISSI
jgi:hypothetical protein